MTKFALTNAFHCCSILFDLLDEREFTKREIRDFCALLFGEENFIVSPSTCDDSDLFVAEIDRIQSKERKHWNPRTEQLEPWINLEQLKLSLGMTAEADGEEGDAMDVTISAPAMIRGSLFGEWEDLKMQEIEFFWKDINEIYQFYKDCEKNQSWVCLNYG